jgi:DNA mismatch repair protein MLH3
VWVDNLLKKWDNPVFGRTEKPISTMDTEFNYILPAHFSSHDCFKSIGSLDTVQVSKFRGKLERRGLENAEVISQVDCKFILVKVNINDTNDHDALVLIDQHAADERCRVEQLFREFFVPAPPVETIAQNFRVRTIDIDTITFEVSPTEGNLFQKYSKYFSQWGIHYNTELKSGSSTVVLVTSLPSLIAERCRLEPNLVIDLIRREIWTREDDKRPLGPARNSSRFSSQDWSLSEEEEPSHSKAAGLLNGTSSWVQQLNGCPQSIIDLLNSRACRSAIMFNDTLSMEECQTLVSRLARCVFPFQCAHGRPSMVPILDLRSLAERTGSARLDLEKGMASDYDHNGGVGFLEAFQSRYSTDNVLTDRGK